MSTPLSPAAQAIVKAFDDRYEMLGPLEDDWQEQCIAAALRAAADQTQAMPSTWCALTCSPSPPSWRGPMPDPTNNPPFTNHELTTPPTLTIRPNPRLAHPRTGR